MIPLDKPRPTPNAQRRTPQPRSPPANTQMHMSELAPDSPTPSTAPTAAHTSIPPSVAPAVAPEPGIGPSQGVNNAIARPAPPAPPAPVSTSERTSSVDTLRGVAVLGILAMNIVAFALPSSAYSITQSPAINVYAGEFTGLNALTWWIGHLFFEQKMMSIFSMLFGAGLVLQDQRFATNANQLGARHTGFAATYYRRLGILLIIGLLHAYLLWFGDILVAYALCGLALYPLRRLRPVWLIAIGLAIFSVAIVLNLGMGALIGYIQRESERAQALLDAGQTLSSEARTALEAWKGARASVLPPDSAVLDEVTARRGPYLSNLKFNAIMTLYFQTVVFTLWALWRALGLMLIGMALAQLGFFAARWQTRSYVTIACIGYGVGLPIVAFGAVQLLAREDDAGYLVGIGPQFNYLGSLLIALAHASVVMLICKHNLLRALAARFASVGRMAFTNYLAQTVICTFIFYGFGLGLFGKFSRAELVLFVLGVWLLQLLWSPLWLARFRFGPAEWVWRSMTYARWQPMLK